MAAAALAAAVLGRADRLLTWRHVPAGLLALFLLLRIGYQALQPPLSEWEAPPDVRVRFMALIPIALVLAALGLAMNAGLASRGRLRSAGAGLAVVMALTLFSLTEVANNEMLKPRFDAAAQHEWETTIHVPRLQLTDVTYVAPGTPNLFHSLPPKPVRDTSIDAVAAPPSGLTSPWEGTIDWQRSRPALVAALILAGLAALVTSLFRVGRDHCPLN
ncbi:hypothetical protein AB0M36_34260 [Actinoplanes sp. NPDC051346]|uniref:hypothetical protein n=1 Tax=Actinoplanes sp. NPDC051346 TaxID=3155048 RepID=UPI0034393913